ncbi:MAG TPA: class I SAM-dependent methyltransferase [Vicinamibacterales bacterium]|nr:class I SAM-dependent methyltransferase [Vicinamibacterales bacterium]
MHSSLLTLVLSASLILTGFAGPSQPDDDRTWKEFVGWLETAPEVPDVRTALQRYRDHVVAGGATGPEADRQVAAVVRLIRERSDGWRLLFNRIYANSTPGFSTQPNGLLVATVEERPPGRALDVGMGQGRNAVFLAMKGWDVTGFDVSEEGLAVAREHARSAGVTITAVQASDETFDYGSERWDLIVITYGPVPVTDRRYADRIERALRPGGLVVIESFASDRDAPRRRAVDIDPEDLETAFSNFRVIRLDDVLAKPDWPDGDADTLRVVRFVGQKGR